MAVTDPATPVFSGTTRARAAVVLAVAAVVAVLANSVIAFAAIAAGASAGFSPLVAYVYGPFTVVGLLAAYVGWRIIRRRAHRPATVLRVLVPVLSVLSFVPDTLLALTGFIPGTSVTAVVALVIMHLVVVAIAVPVSARLAPLRGAGR
jgi:Family of unknown function (DUF6069)